MTTAAAVREDAKDHGLLLSRPMVHAFLDDRKTVTRRLVTKQNSELGSGRWEWLDLAAAYSDKLWGVIPGLKVPGTRCPPDHDPECVHRLYPRFRVGDRIWFRETHMQAYKPSATNNGCVYLADYGRDLDLISYESARVTWKWTPSLLMKKENCRLWAVITEVRPERIQEITGREVLAEGIGNGKSNPTMGVRWENMQRMAFADLWDELNGHRSPWSQNDWVWRISFERTEAPRG